MDLLERDRAPGDQAVADGMDGLAHDGDVARLHGEGVEGGVHRPLQRVLDRYQRPVDQGSLDGHDRVVDRRQRAQLERPGGRVGHQRLVGERPLGAEVADQHRLDP